MSAAEAGARLEVGELIDRAVRDRPGEGYDEVTRAVERFLLTRVLRHTRGHQAQASEMLGITNVHEMLPWYLKWIWICVLAGGNLFIHMLMLRRAES